MGKNAYSLKPMRQENAHWNQNWRIMKKLMRHFTHVLELEDFFFQILERYSQGKHSVALIIFQVKNWPQKIEGFQSAFEIKDSAANCTCRQANLLT